MGAAYFIALERKIDDLDTVMDGKSLAHHIESLDKAARDLGVRPLSEYFSISTEDAARFLEGEGVDADDMPLSPVKHFTAQEGLSTIRALAAHTTGRLDGVGQDLNDCERILTEALKHGVGWHIELDF